MIAYGFDPQNVHVRRVNALASDLGGSASVVQPRRSDGTPGAPILVVEVPDDVTSAQVQAIVDGATGASEQDQAIWERQRKRQVAKAALRDADDRTLIAVRSGLRVIYQSLTETRTAVNQIRAQLVAAGLPLTVAPLINRTWEQAMNAVEQLVDLDPL